MIDVCGFKGSEVTNICDGAKTTNQRIWELAEDFASFHGVVPGCYSSSTTERVHLHEQNWNLWIPLAYFACPNGKLRNMTRQPDTDYNLLQQ